jgi:F0F1-type ATP synthase assembly protein I
MKQLPISTDTPAKDTSAERRQLNIGVELADTTWRIAVPVVLFACLGIVIDRNTGSKPWMTLLGVVIGFFIAAYLIKKQLQRWPDIPVKPGSYERNRKPDDKEDKDYYND